MKENMVEIEVSEPVKDLLVKEGFDEAYGARPLRRAILRLVEDRLSEELLRGTFQPGSKVQLELDETEKGIKVVKIG